MKCPFCNGEMKSGYLQSSRTMFWSVEKSSGVMLLGEEDIKVGKGFWTGCFAPSDYCPRCKKIVTSVSEKE